MRGERGTRVQRRLPTGSIKAKGSHVGCEAALIGPIARVLVAAGRRMREGG